MKKLSVLLVCGVLCVSFCGCGSAGDVVRSQTTLATQTVNDVLAKNTAQTDTTQTDGAEGAVEAQEGTNDTSGDGDVVYDNSAAYASDTGVVSNDANAVANLIEVTQENENMKTISADDSIYKDIDLDLTNMSSTMVYSEVLNIMTDYTPYVDKVIKMNGYASVFIDENAGKTYYACIIPDATSCCAQGIEFVLNSDWAEDEYPYNGQEITVVGKFGTYEEYGVTYFTLNDAELIG